MIFNASPAISLAVKTAKTNVNPVFIIHPILGEQRKITKLELSQGVIDGLEIVWEKEENRNLYLVVIENNLYIITQDIINTYDEEARETFAKSLLKVNKSSLTINNKSIYDFVLQFYNIAEVTEPISLECKIKEEHYMNSSSTERTFKYVEIVKDNKEVEVTETFLKVETEAISANEVEELNY